MAIALTQRRRDRKQGRRDSRQRDPEKAFNKAKDEELQRQKELRRQEAERDIFQTTEGEGIMEGADISLGFDEEEDDLFGTSRTGLTV